MEIRPISIIFAMLALLLVPMALNGCGSEDTSEMDAISAQKKDIYFIGPGFNTRPTAGWISSWASSSKKIN